MATRLLRLLACVVSVLLNTASAFAAGANCDRVCLKNLLDQYLGAVIKHDPSTAPLFVGFRQTENAVVVRRGAAAWKTITGLGKVQRRYMYYPPPEVPVPNWPPYDGNWPLPPTFSQ